MITGLTKFINLYLAPVLSLTSVALIILAYFAPSLVFPAKVALLTVIPSTSLTQPTDTSGVDADGPSVFLGALGSCSRPNDGAAVTCQPATVSPQYDLSVLPSSAPMLLNAPTATTPVFIAIALGFAIIFFFLFTLTAFRNQLGEKLSGTMDKPEVQRATAWIGLLGFMIGFTSFLVIRMWFGKAVEDFNDAILQGGQSAPALVAATSNGFVMVYVAYAFYAVPLVSSLSKLHVMSGKA
ncbi:uncharacterized protein PHACADRAFT_247290 [Phanerochaete carnosa HHB-10118-sp]|uniref:Uncharacterized protein n=1 Tax=Phanerochaete carnosa (strain HHB-10118-sp) TaxID=650164 RepID=K5XDA0_PHACS|nr:uncharacterized protein PHACADRAFT_247290 [Phanerochaete carnosa HHB-10118-sp]EKM61002.1 hypothetical protein PHACADRAFT_247290 [Phanerochaete carnosa HHB-10118-sp]